jgi:hypothetical protein
VNGRRTEYREELLPAFFLRVSSSGARTFGVAYNTPAGQRRRYTIGNAARTSLADARDVARHVLADVVKGHDPQQRVISRGPSGNGTRIAGSHTAARRSHAGGQFVTAARLPASSGMRPSMFGSASHVPPCPRQPPTVNQTINAGLKAGAAEG